MYSLSRWMALLFRFVHSYLYFDARCNNTFLCHDSLQWLEKTPNGERERKFLTYHMNSITNISASRPWRPLWICFSSTHAYVTTVVTKGVCEVRVPKTQADHCFILQAMRAGARCSRVTWSPPWRWRESGCKERRNGRSSSSDGWQDMLQLWASCKLNQRTKCTICLSLVSQHLDPHLHVEVNQHGRKKPIIGIPRKPWMRARLKWITSMHFYSWPHSHSSHHRHEKETEWMEENESRVIEEGAPKMTRSHEESVNSWMKSTLGDKG